MRSLSYELDGTVILREGDREFIIPAGSTPEQVEGACETFFSRIVPEAVSPRQIKLALLAAGKLDAIEAFVASSDATIKINWEYAIEWDRTNPLLNQMATAFGMTSEQVDDLFIAAAAL